MSIGWTRELDEAGVRRLAELLALKLRPGDTVTLVGELGAGKTTFARSLIRALLEDEAAEVPSPTFSLRQSYDAKRLKIAHFDFYRLSDESEAAELGIDDALAEGAIAIEWSERAPSLLPANRFEIALEETGDPSVRGVTLRGVGSAESRAVRVGEAFDFLGRSAAWFKAGIRHLQGDASMRSYARMSLGQRTALLMDAPRQPDGPAIRDGKPYSRIAHLAEDVVRPFSVIARILQNAGLSAPEILAEDPARGFMVIEDLGDRVFASEVSRGALDMEPLWRAAVDALLELRRVPAPEHLPPYNHEALQIETELLLDWYWPELRGEPAPATVRQDFLAAWRPLFDRLARQRPHLVLRDYHSPNLIWLPDRRGVQRVGIIDFQDAQRGPAAYDLVSLLQDARVDVSEDLEKNLLRHYCEQARAMDGRFDEDEFLFAFRALGAQRNTKILGIFVRLARRDGKHQYLAHLPRIWGYLQRNLRHVSLAPLHAWYEVNFPMSVRGGNVSA